MLFFQPHTREATPRIRIRHDTVNGTLLLDVAADAMLFTLAAAAADMRYALTLRLCCRH